MFASSFRDKHRCYEGSKPERNTLIMGRDERALSIIITTASLEREHRTIYKKLNFIFRDAAPDTDQELLMGEG